jgi:hypothetical protein
VNEQLRFGSLDEFQLADVRRWTSQQADYGVMWRDTGASRFQPPQWRLSYIRATGEVYAASSAGPVRLLGVVPADEEPRTQADRNIRPSATWDRTLSAILEGWADPMINDGFSLDWVLTRLRAANRAACEGSCPLGYAPGLPSPCRASGNCMRPTDTSHV